MDDSLAMNPVKRRHRSLAEKRSIVEQALEAGACVAQIARQHGINDNLIFNWRKLYLSGQLGEVSAKQGGLLPVKVRDVAGSGCGEGSVGGTISLKVAKAQIRIEGRADANLLALVLEYVLR